MNDNLALPKIPKILKPHSFANKNLKFSGTYDLSKIDKLFDKLRSGNLNIVIKFDEIGSGRDRIVIATGSIDFSAKLICVNCDDLVDFKFKNDLNIAFIDDKFDENTGNQSILEKYEITNCPLGCEVKTIDLIFDEVLLALPMFAKHQDNCIDSVINKINTKIDLNTAKKDNPFAVLKDAFK